MIQQAERANEAGGGGYAEGTVVTRSIRLGRAFDMGNRRIVKELQHIVNFETWEF